MRSNSMNRGISQIDEVNDEHVPQLFVGFKGELIQE